jgi:hypothetical protein
MTPARILRLLRATWPAPTRTGKRTPPRRACFERRRSRLRFDPRPPVVRQRLRVPLSPELVEQVRRGLDVREEERDRSRGQFPHPRIMTRRLKSNASHPGRTHYEVRVYSTELRSGARSAYPSPRSARDGSARRRQAPLLSSFPPLLSGCGCASRTAVSEEALGRRRPA